MKLLYSAIRGLPLFLFVISPLFHAGKLIRHREFPPLNMHEFFRPTEVYGLCNDPFISVRGIFDVRRTDWRFRSNPRLLGGRPTPNPDGPESFDVRRAV